MAKKLIVLSLDALQTGDLDLLFQLPYCSQLAEKCAIVKNVREIYPTLTYPIHTAIVTGVRPEKNGIPHNQKPGITRDEPNWSIMGSDWYWEKEGIQVPTLVDAVWEDGRTAATVNWPVTAGDTRGYNVPEIWPVKALKEDQREVYRKAASPAAFEEYYDRFISRYDWHSNDDLRVYGVEIAIDILRNHKPDLLLHHIVHLDHARHVHGDHGQEIEDCIKQLDIAVGRIVEATKDAGTYEDTNFVLLGDHGQIDIRQVFHLNACLVDMGFIRLGANGLPEEYEAYSFSAGFSTHIHLKDKGDERLVSRVHKALLALQAAYPQCIDRVYTAEEALKEEGLSGEFSFVVEGALGTLFQNSFTAPILISRESPLYDQYSATHGHHPSKGEKPPFVAFGPDIRPGVVIDGADLLDECPTLAALAGVDMPQMEGKPFPILK
ncbi:alkaline phosphatase family protein [Phocea massiliensis]|uniref:Type I phosphodiesterase / nucleotide pyrophosphatase n=1 Tax=uncultured Anaerotruncus sp. TaxID=905011 RepID=A0A6N2SCF5_9FIRM|nr:alkaline phosphatase family protein [Merdimmobilis hominis]MCD4836254.1 alkaline phosphatase family protein [Merdimmobilis hominis]PWL58939.1 MAG: hypothetical protein DBY34_07005 [Oscillospiraceae bacterium]PWL61617.1 MAG: hypothetical protein DBY34_04245 [Oscillospiraceae bacterium]